LKNDFALNDFAKILWLFLRVLGELLFDLHVLENDFVINDFVEILQSSV
jgi:hypothetical protein